MLEKLVFRPILIVLLKLLFRIEVSGLEHYRHAGKRLVIIANHQSFLDPFLLAVLLPDKPAFAMNVFQAEKWYFRGLKRLVKLYALDPLKPISMKTLIRDVEKGGRVVIFPEGRITTSSGIMKIYEGAGLIVEKSGAAILPVHIEGAQYSKLSFIGDKVKQRWFPKIKVTILAPWRVGEMLQQTGQRLSASALYDLMVGAAFVASPFHRPLLAAVMEAKRRHGGGHMVATDLSRASMNYRQLFTRAFILKEKLKMRMGNGQYVGVLLPNALGAAVTFVSLHMLGRVPAMLNFSSGPGNVVHACRIANIDTVLTSRVFVERGKLEPIIEALQRQYRVVYLEDIRREVTLGDKLRGLARSFFPQLSLQPVLSHVKHDDAAVVLYTSGSEGAPKGVVLSHANLLSNIYQACARIDLNPSDMMFNAMPVFHSFGLTVGLLLPLVQGLKTFLYPSPLHYRIIPDLVYDSNATIMLGTDTFLNGYARYAHPYDFHNIRLAVAGAEKLKEATRRLWADRFCVHVFEGYGVTETSPVLAVNTPMEHKEGTVGRPLPAIECRLQPVEGLDRGGRLEVKGPNVMLGYLKADRPGVVQAQDEWYDTGDIVDIDADGFITILGRAKRFAKIGGEMVSLLAVEDVVLAASPEHAHAAVAVGDARKGEQIILYSEDRALTRDRLLPALRTQGLTELYMPRQVFYMETLPRLGNGKIDYVTLTKKAASYG